MPLDHQDFEPGDAYESPAISEDWIDWSRFQGQRAPKRQYFLDKWLPVGVGAGLYGVGAIGKSLIGQQLQTYGAIGRNFVGIPTRQFRSMGVYCEDEPDELWRRQEAICDHMKVPLTALSSMKCQSRVGKDNLLCTFKDGEIRPTELVNKIIDDSKSFGANVVELDNAAQMFGGNELVRTEVTQFGNLLSGIAGKIGGSVIMLGHPAKNLGSEYSGSTAWDAVVRVRWLFERPNPKDLPRNMPDPDGVRILRRAKANYDARDEIWMRWKDGVFMPFDRDQIEAERNREKEEADEPRLKALREAIAAACHERETPLSELLPMICAFTHTQDRAARDHFAEAIPEAPNGVDVRIDDDLFRLYSSRTNGKRNGPVVIVKELLD